MNYLKQWGKNVLHYFVYFVAILLICSLFFFLYVQLVGEMGSISAEPSQMNSFTLVSTGFNLESNTKYFSLTKTGNNYFFSMRMLNILGLMANYISTILGISN